METTQISLYKIDQELAALIAYREERTTDTAEPPSEEELQALDGEIAKYMQALPQKVEGVAAMFRHWDSQLTTILGPKDKNGNRKGGEVDRLLAIAGSIEGNIARLKEYVRPILEQQPEPSKGCRKLVGREGSQLMLKGNGGLAPLRIQEDILPAEYWDVTVRMPLSAWDEILDALPLGIGEAIHSDLFQNEKMRETKEASNSRIREALNAGEAVPGAYLEPRGVHVECK